MKQLLSLILTGSIFAIAGCSHISNLDDYNAWLNDPDNGCIKTQNVAGVKVTVKYQPSTYLALKDISMLDKDQRVQQRDSLKARHSKGLTFLMTIATDTQAAERRTAGVMYSDVQNYGDYTQRVLATNFFMQQYVSLYKDGVKHPASLAIMENVYELSDKRNFVIVFADDKNLGNGKEYIFVYDDPFFQVGKLQFAFDSKDMKAARDIRIDGQ